MQPGSDREEGRAAAATFARGVAADVEDRDRAQRPSADGWRHLAEWGAHGLIAPRAVGGRELCLPDALPLYEGLSEGCADGGLIFSLHAHTWGCTEPILRFGSPAQRDQWGRSLASGRAIGALAVTEVRSGSSAFSLECHARRAGDTWILSGEKSFVTNGPLADVVVVLARTSDGPAMQAMTAFLVESGDPGLVRGAPLDTLGLRTCPIGPIRLDNCIVSDARRLGAVGSGAALFLDAMEGERIGMAAMHCGVLTRQLERCVRRARTRRVGGTPLAQRQAVTHRIADMRVRLESARHLARHAAELRAAGRSAAAEAAMAKLVSSEALVAGSLDSLRLFAAEGFLTGSEVERAHRDALAALSYSGTSDIQRVVIGGVLGLRA